MEDPSVSVNVEGEKKEERKWWGEAVKKVVCGKDIHPCPGESVLAYTDSDHYTYFLISNTTCFISSSAVCLLLVSGFPLDHRFITWLLSIGMCVTISSLALTCMFGAQMVTPDPVWEESTFMFQNVLYIWIVLLGLVALVLCLRLFAWNKH
ncbi:hypothetical protein V8G54_005195 [Vigna mungo]|uniref:PGG domain-containing protein n=1 Tax=Vigna mungo TaxID=3915 RepID=A0AAQ3PD07_VIGMU